MKKIHYLLFLAVVLSSCQEKSWRQLFNGKDLTGWQQVGLYFKEIAIKPLK